jgi:hypothetical protein
MSERPSTGFSEVAYTADINDLAGGGWQKTSVVCRSAVLDCIGITVEAISPPKSREGVCQNSPCASIRRHQDHRDPAGRSEGAA